jgi:hypothetical protein
MRNVDSFLHTIGQTRGTNSCLTIAPGAFGDSGGWQSTYVKLVELVERSHILHLLRMSTFNTPSIVPPDSVQGVGNYGPALVKEICKRSGENSEDGLYRQQDWIRSSDVPR